MPDACVIGHKAVAEGRIKRILDADGEDCTSLEGSPDWVLEIISKSSVRKDTKTLKTRYYRAGVQEYWLVDARRKEQIDFQIFVRGKDEFKSQPRNGRLVDVSLLWAAILVTPPNLPRRILALRAASRITG